MKGNRQTTTIIASFLILAVLIGALSLLQKPQLTGNEITYDESIDANSASIDEPFILLEGKPVYL